MSKKIEKNTENLKTSISNNIKAETGEIKNLISKNSISDATIKEGIDTLITKTEKIIPIIEKAVESIQSQIIEMEDLQNTIQDDIKEDIGGYQNKNFHQCILSQLAK